jgi:hypothetical protein
MDLASTVYAPPRAKVPWRLETLYAPAAVRHYAYGRQALAAALRLAGVEGKTVLLPAFICREVLSAVAAAGARPAFYGVGPDLRPDEPSERWPDAAAVVAADYFGWPQDLGPFEAYARRAGAVIIEDAAHALFSRDASGRLLGARAPLGILSPRKSLPLPNGGALLVASPALAARLPVQGAFEPAPGRRPALKAAARPLLGLAGAKIAFAALSAWRSARAEPGIEDSLPSDAPCPELARPLECADPAIEISRRRALWAFCAALADKAGASPVFPTLPDGVCPYAFAFRAKDPSAAIAALAAEGLAVLPWPDLPGEVRETAPERYLDVRLAHFLW